MVARWRHHSAGEIDIGLDRYRRWYPQDRIRRELRAARPDVCAGGRAQFRVVEAFGRTSKFLYRRDRDRDAMDATAITLKGDGLVQPAGPMPAARRQSS
jgi:hypothetical protein